jgi:hypothetical protein
MESLQTQVIVASGLWLAFFFAAALIADTRQDIRWLREIIGALLILFASFFSALVGIFRVDGTVPSSYEQFLRFISQFTLTVVGTKLLCSRARDLLSNAKLLFGGLGLILGGLWLLLTVKPLTKGVLGSEILAQVIYVLAGAGATLLAERLGHPDHRASTAPGPTEVLLNRGGQTPIRVVTAVDLLDREGVVSFATSDFFEYELGKPVFENSVQGQFIKKFFSDRPSQFTESVQSYLESQGVEPESVPAKRVGNKLRYPTGTVARIDIGQTTFLPVALTTADMDCVVRTTVAQYVLGLSHLWEKVRIEANDRRVFVPLMGAGLARLGLSPIAITALIATTFQFENAKQRICQSLDILVGNEEFATIARSNWKID